MKTLETIVAVGFVASLSLLGLTILCKNPQSYSANENRYLQTRPEWQWSAVAKGDWQTDVTDYMTDQVPFRDRWTALQAAIQQCYGKRDIGGVYLGDEHCYMEAIPPESISRSRYETNLRAVEALSQMDAPVTLLLVPPAGIIAADKLPAHAPMFDAKALYTVADTLLGTHCTVLNPQQTLQAAYDRDPKQLLYYRTDHHWTTYGAYLGYTALAAAQGRTVPAFDSLPIETVTDAFYGTLYSKVLDAAAVPDPISILYTIPDARVTFDGKSGAVYDMDALTRKDKYQVFFGGNYGRVDIETDNPNGKHLLIFKDSFANAFVPFLLTDYASITMIDMRYQTGDWLDACAQHPDEILVLYELANFAKDGKLSTILSATLPS